MTGNWSKEELKASVMVYMEMLQKEKVGEKFVKVEYYRDLSSKFKRSVKAYEYRMQNISSVCIETGRDTVKGFKPKKNVGRRVFAEIENIIINFEKEQQLITSQKIIKKTIDLQKGICINCKYKFDLEKDKYIKPQLISNNGGKYIVICSNCVRELSNSNYLEEKTGIKYGKKQPSKKSTMIDSFLRSKAV